MSPQRRRHRGRHGRPDRGPPAGAAGLPRPRGRGAAEPGRPGGGARARGLPLRRRAVHPARPPRAGVGLPRAGARPGRAGPAAAGRGRLPGRGRRTAPVVRFHADLEQTAAGFERPWPGSGRAVSRLRRRPSRAIYERLRPSAATSSRPGCADLLADRGLAGPAVPAPPARLGPGARRAAAPVADAVAIWTHVAGQSTVEAAQPAGLRRRRSSTASARTIPPAASAPSRRPWRRRPSRRGSSSATATRSPRSGAEGGRPRASRPHRATVLEADAVVSNAAGVGTYLDSARTRRPPSARRRLEALPLQSPGVVRLPGRPRRSTAPPYLRFHLPGGGELCRLLVTPAVVVPELRRDGWQPARLIAPMDHAEAAGGSARPGSGSTSTASWPSPGGASTSASTACWPRASRPTGARQFHLYRDSMNPVMTARSCGPAAWPTAARTCRASTWPAAPRTRASGSASAPSPGSWPPTALLEDLA